MISFSKRNPPATETAIVAAEAQAGVQLPAGYRRFLTEMDGGKPDSNTLAKPHDEVSIVEFLRVSQVVSDVRLLQHRLMPGCIPIATCEGGNLLCIQTLGSFVGCIYFWDHELESEDTNASSAFKLVAKSFELLLADIVPFDINSVGLQPGQVRSCWVDPELLRKYGRK